MKSHEAFPFLLFAASLFCGGMATTYQVGIGVADITGPAAEVNMESLFETFFQ